MLGLLLIPVALFAGGFAAWQGVFDGDIAVRIVAWTAMMAVYLGLLVLIGIAVATALADVRMSLAALFGVWILFSVALPRALTNAVEIAEPLPQTQAIKQQLQGEAPAYWGAEVSQARQEELLTRYGVSRKEDLPVDERGAQLDAAERHSHEVFDRVLGAFYDQVQAQDALFAGLGFLSPTAAVQSLSQTFAGTDFTHHRQFIEQAETYRRGLVNRMNQEVMKHPVNDGGTRHFAGHELWEAIAPFSYQAPELGITWSRSAAALGALIFWLAASAALYGWTTRGLRP
jgi:ABC-2 type transport system permease protein